MLKEAPPEVPEWYELPEYVKNPGCGPRVILGEPGTGKTELALSLVVHRIRAGMDTTAGIILVPDRAAANRLRDQLALRSNITFSSPVVRTFAGFAYDVLSQAWESGALAGVPTAPRLLSGAEQDTLIEELLAGHQEKVAGQLGRIPSAMPHALAVSVASYVNSWTAPTNSVQAPKKSRRQAGG
ncbi:UvrD-helicase domain-containing protein [Pseudoglutamicibacter albus]|uniref:UvrD-helicase domain-containing protein n=1 Tax=Pseudoglutamicibacter albus TaxID=98671 RepID=UPI003607985D